MKTAAIIPALNEYKTLRRVIEETQPFVTEVIVVDDGSGKPLADQLPTWPHVSILRHKINLGKGAAMTTGVHFAQRLGVEAVVFLDADGQHTPGEIPLLLQPIEQAGASIVFGVRKFHRSMPFVARFGNQFLSRVLALLFHIHVSDTQSGFRAFAMSAYPQLAWQSSRYSVETEMIVNAGKHRLKMMQVPISTIYLDKYKGTTLIDGLRIFFNMISWRIL